MSPHGRRVLLVALAWVVYSVPHLAYHGAHLGHLRALDALAQVVSLSSTLVLALPLLPLLRPRRAAPVAGTGSTSRGVDR